MVARVATLIETITLDFTSGTLLTAAIENAINFEANSDTRIKRGGSTVDYPAFSSIITSFGSFADYTFIGGITGQIIAVVHGIEDDFSRRIEEVKILDGKLVSYELTGSSPITDISYSVKSLTLAPGSYDPGAAVADYTIDVTAFDAGGGLSSEFVSYIIPTPGHSASTVSIGSLFQGNNLGPNFDCFLLASVGALTGLFSAFPLTVNGNAIDGGSFLLTGADSTKCYTFSVNYTGVPALDWKMLIEWTPVAFPSAQSYTGYEISLSDTLDDAIFQTYQDGSFYISTMLSNNKFILNVNSETPVASQIAFVFNLAMTEYTKYQIISDGTLSDAVFMIDGDGNYWFTGYAAGSGDMLSQFLLNAAPAQYRSLFPIKLECSNYCIPLIKQRKRYGR